MNSHSCWWLIGDSIHANAYEPNGVTAQADSLLPSRAALLANVSVQNLSSGGNRASSGGYYGVGWEDKLNALNLLIGGGPPNGTLICLGTNDYASSAVNGMRFHTAMTAIIQRAKSLTQHVVVMSPIYRTDGYIAVNKFDNTAQALFIFQDLCQGIAAAQGVHYIEGRDAGIIDADLPDGVHLNSSGQVKRNDFIVAQMKAKGLW